MAEAVPEKFVVLPDSRRAWERGKNGSLPLGRFSSNCDLGIGPSTAGAFVFAGMGVPAAKQRHPAGTIAKQSDLR
jgi:hypothetical protein